MILAKYRLLLNFILSTRSFDSNSVSNIVVFLKTYKETLKELTEVFTFIESLLIKMFTVILFKCRQTLQYNF